MKVGVVAALTVILIPVADCSSADVWEYLSGPYLGQVQPGHQPEVFAPGIVSHGFHELGITFSPVGGEFFYITSDARYQHYVLLHVVQRDDKWSTPTVAPFAENLSVYSASFGWDGESLFFTGRPLATTKGERPEHDIFKVEKRNGVWGEAQSIGAPVNTEHSESAVSVAADGTLYFHRPSEDGPSDIWSATWNGDRYEDPVRLGAAVNSEKNEARPFIASDQSYMVFQSNREGSLGFQDLYITVRNHDGSWGQPSSLGEGINTAASEFAPSISPDGRYLFFSSYRGIDPEILAGKSYRELLEIYRRPQNGYSTLYWVDIGDFIAAAGGE